MTERPQPLLREIPAGVDYPVDALGPLRSVALAVHDITQAPLAIAAQSALSIASFAVQGFADVETLGGDAPCSLYCLTIAESGERKSACDKQLMKAVREYEAALKEEYDKAKDGHELRTAIWKEKRKRIIAEIVGRDKAKAVSAEADLNALGPAPRPPMEAQVTSVDGTIEGILKLFGSGRPSFGLLSDEAGGFFGGYGMKPENMLKTISGLSKLWDGTASDRVRSGDGASSYPGRRLAAHLMLQPIVVRPLLSDPMASGQGFLARFLMTEPPSAIGTRLRDGLLASSRGRCRLAPIHTSYSLVTCHCQGKRESCFGASTKRLN